MRSELRYGILEVGKDKNISLISHISQPNPHPISHSLASFFLFILIITFFIAGCSRTVTQMPSFGSEVDVEITLAGNADVANNRYLIIFSTLESYQVPQIPPNTMDEFLEPGDEPLPGGTTKEAYYTKYYSTWSGYVVVDNLSGYTLVKGPFISGTVASREILSTLGTVSNTLSFKFSLEKLFGTTLPQQIYVDIVSVYYPISDAKTLKDATSPPTYGFSPIKGTYLSPPDDGIDLSIDPSQDILHWKVSVP